MHCSYSFFLVTAFAMWRPRSWDDSKILTALYTLYSILSFTVYYTFLISQILDIVLLAENIQQITENMIQLINVVNVSQKSLCFFLKRKKIIRFMDYFFEDMTLPQSPREKEIQKSFDDESKGNSQKLFVLYSVSVVMYVYMPFFISKREDRVLPYRAWRPYSLDNVNYYYLAYLHQSWSVTIAATGNAATETLVSGFMIQICAQFEILEHRFMQLPKILKEMRENGESESTVLATERSIIIKLIHHHWRIFEMTELFNDIFVFVILSQFVTSITVLCVSTYNLALCKSVNNDFVTIFMYLLCMLLQIFMYTWYGNEITLRSCDLGNRIFLSEWRSLNPPTVKNLLIIAQRTMKPIILSSGYVITLSNVAFTSIVKTSYSVFNVLNV
ncbi:odorant receptor 80 [Nasonia vitripennis]|uniref:Odorant receptor n=1 Tax=Nasonia vitripennis TaxID=7425 RepID=A0A7M6UDF1_NASVI|nr:odorant receptor 80 [Nasonia vitripennis]